MSRSAAFKPGDRVVRVDTTATNNTGTVIGHRVGDMWDVQCDKHQAEESWSEEKFELVEPQPEFSPGDRVNHETRGEGRITHRNVFVKYPVLHSDGVAHAAFDGPPEFVGWVALDRLTKVETSEPTTGLSEEQLEKWREDCEELGSLRFRDAGDEYHDDDLAFIERAYSGFFRAIAEVRRLRVENEKLHKANSELYADMTSVLANASVIEQQEHREFRIPEDNVRVDPNEPLTAKQLRDAASQPVKTLREQLAARLMDCRWDARYEEYALAGADEALRFFREHFDSKRDEIGQTINDWVAPLQTPDWHPMDRLRDILLDTETTS